MADFGAGEPPEKEGVHGPAGAQSRDAGEREQWVANENRKSGGFESEFDESVAEVAGNCCANAPAHHQTSYYYNYQVNIEKMYVAGHLSTYLP